MTYTAPPQGGPADLNPTIKAILSNADRLAEEAIDLGDYGRTQTAFFLSVLAREEFAKAFLLILAQEERLPWTTRFQDALRSHRCKQLVSHTLCELSAIDLLDPKYVDKWPRRVRELPRPVVMPSTSWSMNTSATSTGKTGGTKTKIRQSIRQSRRSRPGQSNGESRMQCTSVLDGMALRETTPLSLSGSRSGSTSAEDSNS